MNRYAMEGVLNDARKGNRVIVVTLNGDMSQASLEGIASMLDADEAVRIIRAYGKGEIELRNGARIIFRSWRSSTHGFVTDKIFIDEGVDPHLNTGWFASAWASMATSPNAEMIR